MRDVGPLGPYVGDDVRILDDSPIESRPYRIGDVFALYHDGVSVEFKVAEIVERDGRRITYGVPVDKVNG